MRQSLIALSMALAATAAPAVAQSQQAEIPANEQAIAAAVIAPTRSDANRARDRYRHPAETLAFFGVKPTDTIVEFSPGGGWYTEILAPLVKDGGRYYALVGNAQLDRTKAAMAERAAQYGTLTVAGVDGATGASTLPAGAADVVLTFRSVHNLLMGDDAAQASNVFKAFYNALKPGGTLGVVDHRLPEDAADGLEKTSGYLKRSTVIRLATEAGFTLAGESDVNANPKDTHDHPKGVWTLPPSLALKDVDRAKYEAIGESDRMTLKFTKPAG